MKLTFIKDAVWDHEGKSVRGSFCNMAITAVYIGGIIGGLLSKQVADNINSMSVFLTGFFAASFGSWSAKKIIETIRGNGGHSKDDSDEKNIP